MGRLRDSMSAFSFGNSENGPACLTNDTCDRAREHLRPRAIPPQSPARPPDLQTAYQIAVTQAFPRPNHQPRVFVTALVAARFSG